MSGPANAGLFIYAKDLDRLADFYIKVLAMSCIVRTPELRVLQAPDMQLVLHEIPRFIANGINITVPPELREDSALKFFFTVPSLAAAQTAMSATGGDLFGETFDGPGFRARNAYDPEGNIFQLREKR
jgi:predicted enzyme related to lactoylglutathione lyase